MAHHGFCQTSVAHHVFCSLHGLLPVICSLPELLKIPCSLPRLLQVLCSLPPLWLTRAFARHLLLTMAFDGPLQLTWAFVGPFSLPGLLQVPCSLPGLLLVLLAYLGFCQTQTLSRAGGTVGGLGGTHRRPELHYPLIEISGVIWVYHIIGQTPKKISNQSVCRQTLQIYKQNVYTTKLKHLQSSAYLPQ